jgi:hemerythrin-like domain-containing protein
LLLNQEKTMPIHVDHPIKLLRREHDEALAVLDRLEIAVHDLAAPGALAAVKEAIAFLDEDLRAHNEREEETLFPALERYLPSQGPTAVMRFEHRELWNLLGDLESAMRNTPLSSPVIFQRGMAAADLLRRHIAKENGILFPMAEQLLSPDEMSVIARQMESLMEARANARPAASV